MPNFLDVSKPHLESGLYFEPPHTQAFRFDRCDRVVALKGDGLAEMDFGWWDASARTMHLLELKDYSAPEKRLAPEYLTAECVQKATDCVLLLASIWHDLPLGPELEGCVPEEWRATPTEAHRLRLTFVIKTVNQSDILEMRRVQDQVRAKLRGRLTLLQLRPITTVLLMDHRAAEASGVPVQTVEAVIGDPETSARRGGKKRS